MREVCRETGVPIEPNKDEGPATTIGMELDTVALEVRLPQKKLGQLKASLTAWREKKAKREIYCP